MKKNRGAGKQTSRVNKKIEAASVCKVEACVKHLSQHLAVGADEAGLEALRRQVKSEEHLKIYVIIGAVCAPSSGGACWGRQAKRQMAHLDLGVVSIIGRCTVRHASKKLSFEAQTV